MSHLILTHAALGSAAQLGPLAGLFTEALNVHRLDFEGHGAVAPSPRPMRTEFLAENVIDYMDSHRIHAAHLAGHSLGGYVGLYLCLHAPERVLSVHTLGTQVYWDRKSADKMLRELDADEIEVKVPQFAKALAERHSATDWKELVARTANYIDHLGDSPDLTPTNVATIEHPVRWGVGDRDHLVSVEMTLDAVRGCANSELVVFPKTAHPLESVDLDQFATSVKQFVLN